MKELGLSPDEICVFEDSYVALETAKKVGFRTVGIYDQYNYDQARLERASDIYVDKQSTLDSLIVKIEGESL
jgi:beta-phosphoglucomutase-like phosphatase (HAD superfamily)